MDLHRFAFIETVEKITSLDILNWLILLWPDLNKKQIAMINHTNRFILRGHFVFMYIFINWQVGSGLLDVNVDFGYSEVSWLSDIGDSVGYSGESSWLSHMDQYIPTHECDPVRRKDDSNSPPAFLFLGSEWRFVPDVYLLHFVKCSYFRVQCLWLCHLQILLCIHRKIYAWSRRRQKLPRLWRSNRFHHLWWR